VSRADREAAERARLEYEAERRPWNARLVHNAGYVIFDVRAIERRTVVELLADAAFANAPGINRGEYLRLELEPAQLARLTS
jgi:hypothetical protein